MESTKNFLSVNEAYRIAKEKIQNDIKENLKEIEEKITDAANAGEFSVSLDGTLRKQVKDELVKRGYDVQTYSHYNECGYKISWDK